MTRHVLAKVISKKSYLKVWVKGSDEKSKAPIDLQTAWQRPKTERKKGTTVRQTPDLDKWERKKEREVVALLKSKRERTGTIREG